MPPSENPAHEAADWSRRRKTSFCSRFHKRLVKMFSEEQLNPSSISSQLGEQSSGFYSVLALGLTFEHNKSSTVGCDLFKPFTLGFIFHFLSHGGASSVEMNALKQKFYFLIHSCMVICFLSVVHLLNAEYHWCGGSPWIVTEIPWCCQWEGIILLHFAYIFGLNLKKLLKTSINTQSCVLWAIFNISIFLLYTDSH